MNCKNLLRESRYINDPPVYVAGGPLWATWDKQTNAFRANYYHAAKEHRCTAINDYLYKMRSDWTEPAQIARSPWIDMTVNNNRIFAATR